MSANFLLAHRKRPKLYSGSCIVLTADGAPHNGMIGLEEAANLTGVPKVRQKGTRLGNWLTREQAKELLGVPESICGARVGESETVAVPHRVKQGIGVWMAAANIEKGRLLRPLSATRR